MSLFAAAVVVRKELVDSLRDRRAIVSMLLPALLGPVLVSFVLQQRVVEARSGDQVRIAIAGRDGEALAAWLQQQSGVSVVALRSDAEAAARAHEADVTLEVEEGFARDLARSRPAHVRLFTDSTRAGVEPKARRVAGLVNHFGAELAAQRLIVRGVAPSVIAPIALDRFDVASARQRAALLLNVVLGIVMVTLVTAGMQVATDSTAGERERGSLEALLLNAVPRWQIAVGKWLAATAAALAGMAVAIAVMDAALSRLSLEGLGLRFHLGPRDAMTIFAVMSPLAFLLAAIETGLSCFAKSYREAQGFAAVLILPVVVLGGAFASYPVADHAWVSWLPVIGQYAAASQVLAGKAAAFDAAIGAAAGNLALAALAVWLVARMLSSERMIAGR